ncbi:hypothetical protein TraAM80_04832 [Trypanosoma rangeli]|uniref:Uncharacterized protein n=1 Tax=Trypanosoma rangeli TaxID=5698 RepID=A0A3R7L0A9_TRYRA|nr:uncharacterized protein TraAM80_04832 [Trypanosoma rangeli]RNF04994.1 hypothetical protein TraAM80_04832 [Trypanosoma rangeli]|eukprot:RNF04994.1 hypothetical protein TraAM80_04832 [Trypanosoma rangeli]
MMNPDAPPFIPTFARAKVNRQVYTRATLKNIELTVVQSIASAPLTDAQSTLRTPTDFAALLNRPYAIEWLDVAHVASLVRSGQRLARNVHPHAASRDQREVTMRSKQPCCTQCWRGPEACSFISEVVATSVRRAACSRLGAAMLQSGDVVWSLLQMALVFEARQSSLRLRTLAEQHPAVVDRIRQYLCGEGYHLPLPSVTAHEQWQALNLMLKFDWIRDSRTRIFTEISKRWKKRHTHFEQFVHFFEYRDDRPLHPVKNMLTHSAKPVLVSVLSGDVLAVVLLARLGFFVPPDYYWDIFPFFSQALLTGDGDGQMYHLMRHLCLHLEERQRALCRDVYNPIVPPRENSP